MVPGYETALVNKDTWYSGPLPSTHMLTTLVQRPTNIDAHGTARNLRVSTEEADDVVSKRRPDCVAINHVPLL